jgi:hypothetical protein
MKTTEQIKSFLDANTNIESTIAGTGTLYVNYEDIVIRISDHEEANTRLRESADKFFYTRTADNKTFKASDVLYDMLDWIEQEFNVDIMTNEMKGKIFELMANE